MWPSMPESMMDTLYLDAGEPDAATSCTSGSEGGGWKSTQWVTRWPPTLLDGVFFLDLPNQEQREQIWNIHIQGYGLDPEQRRPDDSQWTGAEIRSCCRLAALLDLSLVDAAPNVVPIAVTASETVERLRSWASGRCLSADRAGIYRHQSEPKNRRRVSRSPSAN